MVKRIALICIIFVLLIVGGWQARRFFPYPTIFARFGIENWQVWEFHDYFGLDPADMTMILNDRRITDFNPIGDGRVGDGRASDIFIPLDFVREHFDPFWFWDDKAGALFISTDVTLTKVTPGANPEKIILL